MLDFIAFLTAEKQTTDLANSARPDSLVIEDVRGRDGQFGRVARNRMGNSLRRAADWLDPARDCPQMPHRGSI